MDKLKGRVKRGCQIKTDKVQSANGSDIMGWRTTEAGRGGKRGHGLQPDGHVGVPRSPLVSQPKPRRAACPLGGDSVLEA